MNKIKKAFMQLKLLLLKPYYALRNNSIDITAQVGRCVFLKGCTIGKWCYIGGGGFFNNVKIGNYSCIAPSCQIGGMEHSFWKASISPQLSDECISNKTTIIGHDVWIAANCIIRQGVKIGDGAVVGAHSFVNIDVPPYAIVFGSPARIHKYRFDDTTINKLNESKYWEYHPKAAKQILNDISVDSPK